MPEIGSLYVSLGLDSAQFDRQLPQTAQKLEVVEKATGNVRFAVQNLSFQLNDIATSLASGSSPFRVLAQQSGQLVQVFQQGGGVKNVLGAAATSLRGMITPATVAAAGIAAVVAGLGLLVARAVESENATRQFDILLKGLGTQGLASAAGLEAAAKRLRDVGLSASEARSALIAAQRAGIAPGQAERVVRIGQNLTPVLGEGAPQQLIGAIAGGVDSLGRLALQLGVIGERELVAGREAAQFGRELEYLNRWVGLIEQRTKGLNEEALSPVGRSLRDLRVSIAQLLDAMANSKAIQFLVERLKDIADTLTAIFQLRAPDWWNRLFGQREFTAPIPPASAGSGALDMNRLVNAVIQVESGGNPNAVSSAGAKGLMQLMPGTARQYGVADPFNGGQNVAGGTAYLKDLLAHYGGNVELALMAYNWGPGNLDKALAAGKQAPAGVRAYAAKVMGIAGVASGATAGGNVLTRSPGDLTAATQDKAFDKLIEQQEIVITANRDIAKGYRESAEAGALAEDKAQALAETMLRLGTATSATAQKQIEQRTAQLQLARQFQLERRFAEDTVSDRNRSEVLRLQASLQGKSAEEIERQVDLLRVKQEAEKAGLPISSQVVQDRLREVNALSDVNALLARQRGLWEQLREFGGAFENAFSRTFDSLLDGTFKLKNALRDLANELLRTFANQAFRNLLNGSPGSSGGGLLGALFGGIGGLFGKSAPITLSNAELAGLGVPGFATGGSFMVGGSGAIDSQLVAFRATPGEMVSVTPGGQPGGGYGADVVRIELNPSEGWVAGVADQQIATRSGAIVQVAVRQSTATVRRNFGDYTAQTRARTL